MSKFASANSGGGGGGGGFAGFGSAFKKSSKMLARNKSSNIFGSNSHLGNSDSDDHLSTKKKASPGMSTFKKIKTKRFSNWFEESATSDSDAAVTPKLGLKSKAKIEELKHRSSHVIEEEDSF